jgi:hypothetical protein
MPANTDSSLAIGVHGLAELDLHDGFGQLITEEFLE